MNITEKATIKGEMAKDPICGMVVPKETALNAKVGERTYYFCSESCLKTFESPEKELKDMKKRVTIAISGVLILAILRAGFFLGLATGATIFTWAPIPQLPWFTWSIWLFIITTPVMIFGGKGFLIGAWQAVKNRTANMDLLIAIGTWTAYLYSVFVTFLPDLLPVKERDVYFEVAAIIIAFVLFGKYMEEIIKKRSSAAIRKLMDLKPALAKVLENGREIEVPVENIKSGDVVIIRPGDKIAVDGVVIEGNSAVDEKMISGESIPVTKNKGDKVIGATINKQGMLKVRATNVGQDSTLMQIVKMVENAQLSSVKIQRLADKVASYFVPFVLLVAVLAFVGWSSAGNFNLAILSFVAVLIIACPCALGVATPAALLGGVGKAQEKKIQLPEANLYEAVAGQGIKAKYSEKNILVGNRSFLQDNGISINEIEEGIKELENEGKTTVIVSYDKKAIGVIAVADVLKEFSREAVQELKKMGKEIIMITGDNETVARGIAQKTGIDRILAQVLPKDKASEVKKLQEEGKIVAFVGDGINDSPALAQADIGIAIGSGSDIAKETGGIILIRDDLRDVVSSIKLSQATMKKIKQNLFWAFIYNMVGIPIAALGLLNPIIAAAAMALSSLSVVFNSMLLKRIKLKFEYESRT